MIGSKSRLTPSAPRSRTAAAIWRARLARLAELPSSDRWRATPADVQAKLWTVSTTRAPLAWALFMTRVIAELVQPAQPTVVDPSLFFLWRSPLAATPTPK